MWVLICKNNTQKTTRNVGVHYLVPETPKSPKWLPAPSPFILQTIAESGIEALKMGVI